MYECITGAAFLIFFSCGRSDTAMPSMQPSLSLYRDAPLTTQALPAKTAKTSDSAKPTTIVTTKTTSTVTTTTTTAGSVAADGSGKNFEKKSTFLLVVIIGNQYA